MLYYLVGELARTMASLLLCPGPLDNDNDDNGTPLAGDDSGLSSLPPVKWSELYDDTGDDTPGYSFLIDPRNE
jgi:hypothetical protein